MGLSLWLDEKWQGSNVFSLSQSCLVEHILYPDHCSKISQAGWLVDAFLTSLETGKGKIEMSQIISDEGPLPR